MTAIETARLAFTEGVQLFRPRKGEPGQYDVKPFFSGNKRGWIALDSFSASAIVVVYDNLNEANRAKFAAMPIQNMVRLAFKVIK